MASLRRNYYENGIPIEKSKVYLEEIFNSVYENNSKIYGGITRDYLLPLLKGFDEGIQVPSFIQRKENMKKDFDTLISKIQKLKTTIIGKDEIKVIPKVKERTNMGVQTEIQSLSDLIVVEEHVNKKDLSFEDDVDDNFIIINDVDEEEKHLLEKTPANNEIKTDVNEIKTDVNEIKTDVNEIKTDVNEIKTDVNEIKTDVNEIKTENTEIKGDVNIIQSLITEMAINQSPTKITYKEIITKKQDDEEKLNNEIESNKQFLNNSRNVNNDIANLMKVFNKNQSGEFKYQLGDFNDIDIWCKSHAKKSNIINLWINKGFKISSGGIDEYGLFMGEHFQLTKNNFKVDVDIIVNDEYPVNDFPVNLISYDGKDFKVESPTCLIAKIKPICDVSLEHICQQIIERKTEAFPDIIETDKHYKVNKFGAVTGKIALTHTRLIKLMKKGYSITNIVS
jgi:hypothetical protein